MEIQKIDRRIFSTQYFGGIEFYATIIQFNFCAIEGHENYQKRSLRNRVHILGPQGKDVLTVPLIKGKNAQSAIEKVEISYDEDWVRQHLQSIQSYYGKSPFLEYYIDDIQRILMSKHTFLWDLNNALITYICKCLEIESNHIYTKSYHREYIYDYRNSNNPSYEQMRAKVLEKLRYNQVFEEKHGFVAGLSILDLLFCRGPEAGLLLKRVLIP